MLVEPSGALLGASGTAMSAMMTPGMSNSTSSSPAHRLSATAPESGPETRRSNWWRSPVNVSDCHSVDRTSLSNILSRGTPARAVKARRRAAAAADIGVLFIARRPPDKRALACPSAAEGPGHCEDRRQIADRRPRLVQIGSEQYH